jgi:TRAP-type C4-dicarboxylate transport system permease small subunit
MRKILETVDRITTTISVVMMAALVLILTANILLRFFSGGFSWYMETSTFLNVWSVFIASVGLCATNDHLHIDAIEGVVKGQVKRAVRLVICILTVFFFIVMGYAFLLLASRSRQTVSTMPALKMAWIYWPIPILCFFSAITCAMHGIWDFTHFGSGEKLSLLTGEMEG